VPFSIQAIDTIHGQIALPNAAEPLVVRWADAPGSRRRDSREKGGKQKGQRQGGMGGMGGMGGLMMMGGGGEAGQGYNKQNPYAYGEPPRIDPPPIHAPRLHNPGPQAAAHAPRLQQLRHGAVHAQQQHYQHTLSSYHPLLQAWSCMRRSSSRAGR